MIIVCRNVEKAIEGIQKGQKNVRQWRNKSDRSGLGVNSSRLGRGLVAAIPSLPQDHGFVL